LLIYILNLNFLNQASIIDFHLGFVKTWFHWNKGTFIHDFLIDVIVREASISINFKFHPIIKINYSKIIYCLFFNHARKEKKNLHIVVGFPLSNVFFIVYILLIRHTLYARRHRTRRAYVEKGCMCLKCLIIIGT
jgi:hypothetical protein